MMVRRSDVEQLEGTLGRARSLGENAVYYNDPNVINSSSEMVNKVTKADIQRVAQTYLTQNNRTVVTTLPKPRTGGAQ
jgi:predicted Zn-dependent peptidase